MVSNLLEMNLHEMQLEKVYSTGAEEWICSGCSFRILVNWQPQLSKIVLDPGENEVVLHWFPESFTEKLANCDSDDEDPKLAVWAEWLKDVDFGDWRKE